MQKENSSNYSENLLYVLSMLECIEKLKIYSSSFSNADEFFEANDQLMFNASCHLLLAIGEEAKKIDILLKDEISFLQWDEISGLRNRIAHDYRGLDPDIVFSVILNELDILKQALIQLVKIISPPKQDLQELVKSDFYKHLSYLIN